MGLWDRLRLIGLFLKFVKDPTRTDLIFSGIALASRNPDQEMVRRLEDSIMAQPGVAALYAEKYLPVPPAMDRLASMPEGSFGREVFRHMDRNRLTFDIWPRFDFKRPIEYVSLRMYQDHDLFHVLLQWDTSVESELGLVAFAVAQLQSPGGVMVIAAGLLHLLKKSPERAVRAVEKIAQGYSVGRRCRLMLTMRLYERFETPLTELRELCEIPAPA